MGTIQSIPAGRGEGPSLLPTGMGGAGMRSLNDKLVHVGFSGNPLVAQIWGGFPRSQDGKALQSFVLPIVGWQLFLSDWGKGKRPALLVLGKSPLRFCLALQTGRQTPIPIRSTGMQYIKIQGGSTCATTFLLFLPGSTG